VRSPSDGRGWIPVYGCRAAGGHLPFALAKCVQKTLPCANPRGGTGTKRAAVWESAVQKTPAPESWLQQL